MQSIDSFFFLFLIIIDATKQQHTRDERERKNKKIVVFLSGCTCAMVCPMDLRVIFIGIFFRFAALLALLHVFTFNTA